MNSSCWYNSTAPWNTTGISGDPSSVLNLLLHNIPWFMPAITLMLMVMSDYIVLRITGVKTKVDIIAIAIAYTIVSYVEVLATWSTTNYFFLFEFVMLISMLLVALFKEGIP